MSETLVSPTPEREVSSPSDSTAKPQPGSSQFSEELLWRQLRNCFDPEIPCNIVELGLIYGVQARPLPDGSQAVHVRMTLTAPGCSMGGMIVQDVQNRMLGVPGVSEAEVEVVWDPPWSPAMMTEAARLQLGLV